MKRNGVGLIAVLLLLIFVVANKPAEQTKTVAQPDIKTLMNRALAEEFTPGREILMDLVEIPPNTALERHWHPGEEFHYYLEGEVEVRIDGEPTIVGKPGTVGHVPYKKMHTAVTGKKGAKVLVVRVHTTGEPARYLEKDTTGKP